MLHAFQWDLARQVERLDWLLARLPDYAKWGYDEVYLHLEDAVEYPSLPGVARRDAYSHRQIARLVDAATRVGIGVVPIVNLLGHTQYLIKDPDLRDLNELRAPDGSPLGRGQICPVHPRTPEVAEKLLRDVLPLCTAGKVHVGLDESFHLGRHPASRREIERIGLAAHFAGYVARLRDLARSLDLRMAMWADMLYFLPGAIRLLPRDVALHEWYYYPFARRPRVELFEFAETDLGERLRARRFEYWGCAMDGSFRHEPLPHFADRLGNVVSWWRRCRGLGAAGFLVTGWEPSRLALELTTVVDAAAASLWLDGCTDPRRMLEHGFERVFGKRGAGTAARTAMACDRYPFCGYPRWGINSRWDAVSRRESIAPYRREERFFRGLVENRGGNRNRIGGARRGRASDVSHGERGGEFGDAEAGFSRLPAPLRASIAFRWYLAARDVFVRETQRAREAVSSANPPRVRPAFAMAAAGRLAVLQAGIPAAVREREAAFRSALRVGFRAAREMWARTRNRDTRGPNQEMVGADLARLEAFGDGKEVFGPVWQLCYRICNFAPCVQLVAVEQLLADGKWHGCEACYTIEFQAHAARPGASIEREHAAPVEWNGNRDVHPRLRFTMRGAGRVRIESVELRSLETVIRGKLRRRILGRGSARRGFPRLDRGADLDRIEIQFTRTA